MTTLPLLNLSTEHIKFEGEGIVDNSVWLVKSHYPERMGYLKYRAKRVILVIRNPFDAIESYFHMGMTNTHDKNLSVEVIAFLLFIIVTYCVYLFVIFYICINKNIDIDIDINISDYPYY